MGRKGSRFTPTRLNTAILGIAALIPLLIAGLSYRDWTRYRRASADATRATDILGTVNRLLSALLDAETGQRGFLLTGEDRYLGPYHRAIQIVPTEVANLNRLSAQREGEPGNVARLNVLVEQKLVELRQTIDLRRTQGIRSSLDVVLSERGRQAMDEIRSICMEIRQFQLSAYFEDRTERERSAQRMGLAATIGALVLFAFLIVAMIIINRETRAREQSLREAQNTRDSLKTTLASIGDAVISTDAKGHIVFANKVAQSLVKWPEADLIGTHLDQVFRIVNEYSRAKVESPVGKVSREGAIVGLANHTVLIARDGTEIPIDDSGAPIRGETETIEGTVLVFRDITARRRADVTSRLLSSIVESSDDAIISKDLNGVITSWNRGAERIFGYSAEEAIGQSISMLAPSDAAETPGILERIKQGEQIDHYETVRRTKNGTLVNVSVSVSPVRDALGRIVGASKIARDITERRRMEREVRESAEGLQLALKAGRMGVWDWTMATGRVQWTPTLEAIHGLRPGTFDGTFEAYLSDVHPDDLATVRQSITRSLEEKADHDIEYRIIWADGSLHWIHGKGRVALDTSGNAVGMTGVCMDISERKQAEHALRESEQRFRNLADNAPVLIWVAGLDKKCTWFNRPWLEFTGRTMEQEVGDGWAEGVHVDDLERCLGIYVGSFDRRESFSMEYRLRRHDGVWRWILDHGIPLSHADGHFLGYIGSCIDISERRQAEELLRNTNEALQQYADIVDPAAVLVRDVDDHIIRWTSGAQALYGLAAAEAVGKISHDLFHTRFPEPLEQIRAKLFDSGRWEGELRHRKSNGREVVVASVWALHRDKQGVPTAILEVNSDITERKRAEERFHQAVESAPNAMVMVNHEGTIVLTNSQIEKLFGYTQDELVGRPVEILVPVRFRGVHHEHRKGFLGEPQARPMGAGRDLYGLRKNGTEFPVEIGLNPIQTEEGPWVLSAVVDITERKRLEHGLRELAEIVESSDDAIIGEALDCTITTWNRGAEKIYGYAAHEIIGRPLTILAPPGREHEIPMIMERIRRSERIEQYETQRQRKDGTIIDVSLTISSIQSDTGVTGAAVVARDITERVRAGERLARLNAELEESNAQLARTNEDLERFAFVASHDLQEPLRMITAYAQLLVKEYPRDLDGDATMFVSTIVESTKRMRELLADLLTYTEIRGRSEEPAETVDLNVIIEKVKLNLKASIDDSGAVITNDRLPTLNAHAGHLVPLFQNLIGNALKYRSEHPPRVHISVQETDGQLRLAVADNGIGIDPEYHEKIFVVFKRLHGRKIPGTGIGLAICQRVVERYGGRIWVESEVGQGATFLFTLPNIAVHAAREN